MSASLIGHVSQAPMFLFLSHCQKSSLCGSRFFPQSNLHFKTLHALVRRSESLAFGRVVKNAADIYGFIQTSSTPPVRERTFPFGNRRFESLTHVFAPSVPHWKSLPSTHIRCRITASLRDTATRARFLPLVFINPIPHAFSDDHPVVLVSNALAAA